MHKPAPGVLHVLPPFGTPGVCRFYDEDCALMTPAQHVSCFMPSEMYDEDTEGVCPFLD